MLYDCFYPCYSTTFGKSYCLALVLLSNTTRLPCHFWAIYALIRYTKTRFTANSTKILGFTILTLYLRKGSFCYITCYTSLHSTKQDSLDLEFYPSLVYFSRIEQYTRNRSFIRNYQLLRAKIGNSCNWLIAKHSKRISHLSIAFNWEA